MTPYEQFEAVYVSIHATLAGGDGLYQTLVCDLTPVSIHATLAGGDPVGVSTRLLLTLFLSTPPSRVATCKG